MLHLFLRQGGGGLVEHDDLGVVGNGLGDLYHLPLGDGHGAHNLVGIHVDSQLLEHGHGVLEHFLFVHQSQLRGIAAQPQVVHDGTLQCLVQFLMDHGHAVVQGFLTALEVDLPALEINVAFILIIDAEQALHQGGLACAVFAHQGMDRTGLHLQGYMIQRFHAGKGLGNVYHFQENFLLCHWGSSFARILAFSGTNRQNFAALCDSLPGRPRK